MIYACLRFIEEWAHPLAVVNFTLIGLSSGLVLGCALAAWAGATGIKSPQLVQKSMGMSAGAFNTREFFHGVGQVTLKYVKVGFVMLAFALPALLLLWGVVSQSALPWVLAAIVQAPGLIAERWFFFAQAKHPQNLYYQVIS